jgi:hypothetical protein
LEAEPLFRFFYRLRTDSMKRAAPKFIWLAPVFLEEGMTVTKIQYADPDGPDAGQMTLIGTDADGQEFSAPARAGFWTVQGLPPQYRAHPVGLLMQRYLAQLERIAMETLAEFWTEEVHDDTQMRDLFLSDHLSLNDPGE